MLLFNGLPRPRVAWLAMTMGLNWFINGYGALSLLSLRGSVSTPALNLKIDFKTYYADMFKD